MFLYLNVNSDPPTGVTVNNLPTTKIDFNLHGIYFYQDDNLWNANCLNAHTLLQKIESTDSNRMKQLNICFTEGVYGTASSCASMPSIIAFDMYILILRAYSGDSWCAAIALTHEMGHCLGLTHTYSGGGASAICDTTHYDFLYDVFGIPSTCPHNSVWANPWASPTDKITNNFMGGSN